MKRKSMTAGILLGSLLISAFSALITNAVEAVYTPTDDNFILNDYYTGTPWHLANWGAYNQLAIGLNAANQPFRGLMRFDLSSLGSANSITSATLTVTVTRTDKLTEALGNFDLNLFLLDDTNTNWVEGASSETTAAAGEPCWRYRQYNTEDWTGGPGIGNSTASAGISDLLASVSVDVTNTVVGNKMTFTINSTEGIAALTAWAAGENNAGLLLTTDETDSGRNAIYFGSKEYSTTSRRPVLTVYTTAGETSFGTSDDTFIWNSSFKYYSGFNWGAKNEIFAGENNSDGWAYRSLLRFNTGDLRARYTSIDSSTLTLTVTATNRLSASLGDFNLHLFQLDDSNSNWVEGTKNSSIADTGESCWEKRKFDLDSWTGGQGIGNNTASSGISNLLATVSIDVDTITNGQKIVFTLNSPEAIAAVKAWCDGDTNAGLLLASDEASDGQNALVFASSEHATAASRPQLAVTYTADATDFGASDDNFIFSLPSWANANWGAWSTPEMVIGMNNTVDKFRGLMRFDPSSLDLSGKQVKWATLKLTIDATSKIQPANGDFDTRLFLLANTNADWVEGTKDAEKTAGTGESCWAWRKYATDSWTGGAGIGNSTNSPGISALLDSVFIDTSAIAVGKELTFVIDTPAGLAALTSWVRGGTNPGFLLTTDESPAGQNAIHVASKEHGTASRRPVLRIVLEPKIASGTVILLN
ncbi:MAG: DNRLRE domain-containing protein [Kiritimatiellae bacterium]|nr:DNRLRE domain-containing protein [Kiritimatiellia bacterium]